MSLARAPVFAQFSHLFIHPVLPAAPKCASSSSPLHLKGATETSLNFMPSKVAWVLMQNEKCHIQHGIARRLPWPACSLEHCFTLHNSCSPAWPQLPWVSPVILGGLIVAWVAQSFSEPSLLLIAHFIPLTPWRVFVTPQALSVCVGCLVVCSATRSKASHFIYWYWITCGQTSMVWALQFVCMCLRVCRLSFRHVYCWLFVHGAVVRALCSACFDSECNIIFSLPASSQVLNRLRLGYVVVLVTCYTVVIQVL